MYAHVVKLMTERGLDLETIYFYKKQHFSAIVWARLFSSSGCPTRTRFGICSGKCFARSWFYEFHRGLQVCSLCCSLLIFLYGHRKERSKYH